MNVKENDVNKIAQILILAGKYIMIIGIALIIIGWLFPDNASAMITTSLPSPISMTDVVEYTCDTGNTLSLFDSNETFLTYSSCPQTVNASDFGINDVGIAYIIECDSSLSPVFCDFTGMSIGDARSDSGYISEIQIQFITPPTQAGGLFPFKKENGEYSNSATDLVAGVGIVSTDTFNGALPYMLLFIGVPLSFFIIQSLKKTVVPKDTKKVFDIVPKKSYGVYHATFKERKKDL